MIHALLRSRTEQLMVFAEDPAEDRSGPYQHLAPDLLALPDGQVRWLVEAPLSVMVIDVPAAFVAALLAGKPAAAGRILQQAIDDSDAGRCPDPEPHSAHEWYGEPAAIRRNCLGREPA